jgi:hypothetical protein
MAVSWGRGGDFKFYTGSSQNNPWTRDLLHKKRIVEEAKLMGFLPKPSGAIGRQTRDINVQANNMKKQDEYNKMMMASTMNSTSNDMNVNQGQASAIQPQLIPTPRQLGSQQQQQQQPKKIMTNSQRKAHLKQAKNMYEERKRLGGRITKKEEEAWRQFLEGMEANGKKALTRRNNDNKNNNNIQQLPASTLNQSIASFARTPIQTSNGRWQKVNSIALARESQAIRDRKKAVVLQKRRTQRVKLRGLKPKFNHPLGKSVILSKSTSEPNFSDSFGRGQPAKAKKADWTTPSVAKIFEPLESEKIGDQLQMKSTYDKNYGERNNHGRSRLVGGYFVKS